MATATEDNLDRALDSMRYWGRQADEYTQIAGEMRRTAHELDTVVAPLDDALTQIRDLHTPSTWMGNAAKTSRFRLDVHDHRCNSVRQMIHHLIDDLYDEAAVASRRAGDAWEKERGYRLSANKILVELGHWMPSTSS